MDAWIGGTTDWCCSRSRSLSKINKEHLAKTTTKWDRKLQPGQWDSRVCVPTVFSRLSPARLPLGLPFLPLRLPES